MEPLKKALHKLLFPGKAVVLLSVLLSAFLLAYTFSSDTQHASPVAYIAYLVSAYSLTVVCTNGFLLFRKGAGFARQNVWVNRYITDVPFRVHISFMLLSNLFPAFTTALFGWFLSQFTMGYWR